MNALRIFILSLMTLTLITTNANAHQKSWPGKKLSETFPDGKNFVQKQVTLNAAQIKWVENGLGEKIRAEDSTPVFYSTTSTAGAASSWVVFVDATGANGKIEMGVAFDSSGKVINLAMLDSSESKDVQASSFLKQFVGKVGTEKFKVGEDIRAPEGQSSAAQAIAMGVRRGLLLAMAALGVGSPK
jgi:hypothetical protein